ncbi:MAG TPA: hypothetical protein VFB32_16660 [Rudaea sp.]|nr:hypothetical protein [Rudaea sp.]
MAERRHEHENAFVDARRVCEFAALLAAILAGVLVSMYWLWRGALAPPPDAALRASPSLPVQQLADLRARQQAQLEGYAWLDSEHRYARIPVERAMAIEAERAGHDRPETTR